MIQRAVISLVFLLAVSAGARPPPEAEASYQKARNAYYALKKDAVQRKLRHKWLQVAQKFQAVAATYPQSPRAPDALYSAADLYSELSRISGQSSDLKSAILAYQKLLVSYPKHRLADDALFSLVRIHSDRQGDLALAYEVLTERMKKVSLGDKRSELLALKASLPKPVPVVKKTRETSATPTPSVMKAFAKAASLASDAAVKPEVESPTPTEVSEAVAEEEVASTSEVAPAISQWQEALRDVRVGTPTAREDERVSAAEAKARLAPVTGKKAEVTLAEQLGLKVRRVVLDAGHGGHDSGAIGPSGVREKDVALGITRKLAVLLRNAGLEVELTRDSDRFVALEKRTQFANDAHGDLFISIHCNASPNRKARGIETYTLNTSADRYAIRLAARENASSEKGISDLQYILADLTTKANTDESTRLAARVQKALVSNLSRQHSGVKDLGHKEALFFVLLGARMPSILVETSFLSNPTEEKLLASEAYQALLAHSIFSGIQSFMNEREKFAQVQ